jgi:serum/glucocorticoid-regulated kinase 2
MEKEHFNLEIKDFSMLSLIGFGNYAKVVLVRKKSNGKLYAMKIVKKKKIISEDNPLKDKTVKNHVYV